ncbi:MAG: desulfoferrodoxin FeS4 iron-binding domain-containing protein [Nitrospirota bacterium]
MLNNSLVFLEELRMSFPHDLNAEIHTFDPVHKNHRFSQERRNDATKVGQKYKCDICGNEVVVTHEGEGELVCCGQPMSVIGEGFKCK